MHTKNPNAHKEPKWAFQTFKLNNIVNFYVKIKNEKRLKNYIFFQKKKSSHLLSPFMDISKEYLGYLRTFHKIPSFFNIYEYFNKISSIFVVISPISHKEYISSVIHVKTSKYR